MSRKLVLAAVSVAVFGVAAAVAVVAPDGGSKSDTIAQPSEARIGNLPVASAADRVDLAAPTFSQPTDVTNELHPTGKLASELLLGSVDGEKLRVEITLLPETRLIEWNGQRVETLVAQYVAYLGGRIHEVALDFYAQADDGAVWYFGEDVYNYEDGVVADTEGTWLAGVHGPAAMIMPADPEPGDVYRPENMPGFVFEEVTVVSRGDTVQGPRGQVSGALIVRELHLGSTERKTFAPGYGEFYTASGGDVEALALAVPIDAVGSPVPAELTDISAGAAAVFAAGGSGDWMAASARARAMTGAWRTLDNNRVPPLLGSQMTDALSALAKSVKARDGAATRQAAIDVARASLDLQLRHRPPLQVDVARFDVRAVQLLVDAEAGDQAAVRGDFADLEWIRDRIAAGLANEDVIRIDVRLDGVRAAVIAEDPAAASRSVTRLRTTLAGMAHGTEALAGFDEP
jgi:hypothetical protein